MPVFELSGFNFPVPVTVANFPAVIRAINTEAAMVVMREARENAWQFHDTGALARSIEARVSELQAVVSVPPGQPTAAYALVMEEGRTPGRRPPPPQSLLGWMRRRGIPEHLAYVIARAIGRRGIEGRHYMRRAYESLEHQMPAIIDRVMHRMGFT